MGDRLGFLGGKLVEVFIHGLVWLDLVLDSIQTSHHLSGKGEIGVTGGIGCAELDALRFRVGSGDRNPDRSGSVTGRIHQVDGGFKACHQAVVAVEAGVCESKERWCVLQDSTDIPAGQVAQTAISGLVIEQGLTFAPERLVGMHS